MKKLTHRVFDIVDYLVSHDASCSIIDKKTIVSVMGKSIDTGCVCTLDVLLSDGVISEAGTFQRNYDKRLLRRSISELSEGLSSEIEEIVRRFEEVMPS